MAINKKLIHFTNKVNFLNEYNKGNILPTSIVFIQDAKQIWTHDEFYSCPFTEEEINQLLVGSNIKLNGYTEITSPIEISAADTVNSAFGKIEDYLNSILELNAVLVDTGDAVYESPMINDYITANTFSSTLLNYVSDSELASKNYATKQDVADLVDGAPETLNTLNELAAALKDNAGIVDILNESISSKLSKTEAAENYQVKGDYITKTEVANSYLVKGNYVLKSDLEASIPTKVSQLENDVPYVVDITLPENGLYIYDTDGNFTLPDNWNTSNNIKAVGVAILGDDCRFVVAKEDIGQKRWGGYNTDIASLTNYTSSTEAAKDFAGITNTQVIINAIGQTNDGYRTGSAAQDCVDYIFPNGQAGYLGAAGEWQLVRSYKDELNSALELIGGTKMAESYYWTSTEYSSSRAWNQWFDSRSLLSGTDKYIDRYVRAFLAIEVSKPLKERVSELELNYFKWSKLILPSFTIDGVSYDFEEGMTWEDWVNSDYNTNGAYMGDGQEILLAKETYILKEKSYAYCASWEVINSSEKYRIYQWDGTGMRPGVEL